MILALFGFGGSEIILILALIFILLGAKKLPEFAKGLRTGFDEFKKATREVTREVQEGVTEQSDSEHPDEKKRLDHPLLMALTFILGAVCLVLICHELSK